METRGGSKVKGALSDERMPPLRQRSGLVRTAGAYDAFVFALATTSVGIMTSWGLFFGNGFYPGANFFLALAIAAVAGLAIAWAYQYWGQVFPRSGGDYVFLSRGLHPGLGLGLNFVFVLTIVSAPAFAMSILDPLVSSFAAALASATGSESLQRVSTWVTTSWGYAVVGTVPLAVAGLVGLYGLRGQLRLLNVLFVTGFLGTIILSIALLTSSPSAFAANLKAYTGLTPQQVQAQAAANGFVYGGFSFTQTLKLSNWFAASLFFTLALVYIGGEIKEIRKTLRRGMIGAVLFVSAATAVFAGALDHVVPGQLQGALAYNAFVAPEASTPGLPYPHELLRVLWGTSGGGLVLTIIGFVSLLAWVSIWAPSVVPVAQRAFLAWSLDGVAPRWLGYVSPKRNVTIPALGLACLITWAYLLAFAFSPNLRTIVLLIPQYMLVGVTLAVGIFFPFARKDLFRQSIIANLRTAGIPSMAIGCAIGTAVIVAWTALLWVDPVAAGTSRRPLWTAIGIALFIAVYYAGLRAYRRRQGQDISLTFKRIPVE